MLSEVFIWIHICTRLCYNEIQFKWINNNPISKFYFHLQGLSVDSILNETKSKIIFQKDSSISGEIIYNINRNQLLKDTNKIFVFYHGTMTAEAGKSPWGGVAFGDSILYALGVGFRNDYVSATRHWLPCYDHPSDKALFTFSFKYDDSLNLVSNGLKIKSTIQNKIKNVTWVSKYPMSSYLATFALGKSEKSRRASFCVSTVR